MRCSHLERLSSAKETGITAHGVPNATASEVFSDISRALQAYYHEQCGLILVEHVFEPGTRRYELPVYQPRKENPAFLRPQHVEELEELKARLRRDARFPVESVALIPHAPRVVQQYVKNWDFPHLPWEREFNACSAYFNVHTGMHRARHAQEQRDTFFDYVSQSALPFLL